MKKYSFLFPILALGCETKKSENNNDLGNYDDILTKLKEFSQNNASQASFDNLVAENIDKSFGDSVREFAKQGDIIPENKGKTLYRLLYALFDETKNPENIKNALSEVDPTVIIYIKQGLLSNGDNDREKNKGLLEILESISSNKQKINFHPSPYLGEDAPAVGSPDSTIKNVNEWLRYISINKDKINLDKGQWELGLGLVKDKTDFNCIFTSYLVLEPLNQTSASDILDVIRKVKNKVTDLTFSDETLEGFINIVKNYDKFDQEKDLIEISSLCNTVNTLLKLVHLYDGTFSIINNNATFLGLLANNRASDFDSIVQIIPDHKINTATSAIEVLNSIVGKKIVLSQKSLDKILLFMGKNIIQAADLNTLMQFICKNVEKRCQLDNIFAHCPGNAFNCECFTALINFLLSNTVKDITIDDILSRINEKNIRNNTGITVQAFYNSSLKGRHIKFNKDSLGKIFNFFKIIPNPNLKIELVDYFFARENGGLLKTEDFDFIVKNYKIFNFNSTKDTLQQMNQKSFLNGIAIQKILEVFLGANLEKPKGFFLSFITIYKGNLLNGKVEKDVDLFWKLVDQYGNLDVFLRFYNEKKFDQFLLKGFFRLKEWNNKFHFFDLLNSIEDRAKLKSVKNWISNGIKTAKSNKRKWLNRDKNAKQVKSLYKFDLVMPDCLNKEDYESIKSNIPTDNQHVMEIILFMLDGDELIEIFYNSFVARTRNNNPKDFVFAEDWRRMMVIQGLSKSQDFKYYFLSTP